MRHRGADQELEEFRRLIQQFVRRFGFLADDATPCGEPIPLACAHALLLIRGEVEGSLPQSVLREHLSIDKSNVSRLVARLVEMGWVVCHEDATDRRGKKLVLTPKGVRTAERLDLASKDRFSRLRKGIPPAKRAHVVAALGELVKSLVQLEPNSKD